MSTLTVWPNLEQLAKCRVFIFDLDGTVYQETHHFAYYGERLAALLGPKHADAFLQDVELILAGRHPLAIGDKYDVINRVIRKDTGTVSWEGSPVEVPPSSVVLNVEDPWWVYGSAARHHGLSEEEVDRAYLETRAYMESDAFAMAPIPGLRAALDGLRRHGWRLALATNSPEPDSRAILTKLDLADAFDDLVFRAKKPIRSKEHFTSWQQAFGFSFDQMASIGDNFLNDVLPALELGMKAIYIDRYVRRPRAGVTAQIASPLELGELMAAVLKQVES
ncbi:MAG: HAD family hydrolase [Alicyclobacillus sp.]|nr:HAD family hydrolase [Alicyclobacillus sp.]